MLLLTRRIGEIVVIAPGTPHECRVWVQEIRTNGNVKLAFHADPSVIIHRSEIQARIEGEHREQA